MSTLLFTDMEAAPAFDGALAAGLRLRWEDGVEAELSGRNDVATASGEMRP